MKREAAMQATQVTKIQAKVPARRDERGLALMELMLLTVPLSVLSIVLASAIAATATAKNKSMWKASLQAQRATREPCGGVPLYFAPTMSQKNSKYTQGRGQANEIGIIGLPITLTGRKTEDVTEKVPTTHFDSAADKMFPGRTKQAQNSATFVCNEPNNGNSRRAMYEGIILTTKAIPKARGLF
jgi:hypothetical protein